MCFALVLSHVTKPTAGADAILYSDSLHLYVYCSDSLKNNMHSHCSRNFSATLSARTRTRSCKLRISYNSGLFNIYFQDRQWICFLKLHDVCLDEYQDMAGIFVVEVKAYRKKERRFAFVDIGNGWGWGNSRPVSLSLSGCSKQCLISRSWFWFGLRGCLGNQLHTSTLYPYMYILILSHNEINHIIII